MSHVEFERWVSFYKEHPFDDLHRYHRPAALISVSMGGGDIKEKLDYLHPEPLPEGMSMADVNTLKAFGLTPDQGGEA